MKSRLQTVNTHFKPAAVKFKPTDVWESLNLDDLLSNTAVRMRKETKRVMEEMEARLIPHIEDSSWPEFIFQELKAVGINGLQTKDFGGPGLSTIEAGAVIFEIAKIDGSVAMSFLVQNCLGIAVVDALGDDDQRARLLPSLIHLEKFICFGLSEPSGGSNASDPLTVARKAPGGFILNGHKRWMGQGTYADYNIIWAKNIDDGGKVQGFIVEKDSKGLSNTKI